MTSTHDTGFGVEARSGAVPEGSALVQHALFDVTRWGDLSGTQHVTWSVALGFPPAADAQDFVDGMPPQGSLTFLPGEASKTIAVALSPDVDVEPVEWLEVVLWDQSGGLPGAQARVAIINDDTTVEIRRQTPEQAEGDEGTTLFTFELLLAGDTSVARNLSWQASPYPVSDAFGPRLGVYSADAADFVDGVFPSGTVSFAPGETRKTVTIAVAGDVGPETNELFRLELLDLSPGLTLGAGSMAGVVIRNDDPLPAKAYDDAYVTTEGSWVTSFRMQAPSVLGNDIGATAAALESGPSHGTLEFQSNGDFTYKPDAGFTGIDGFTYIAAGPDGASTGRVTLHVAPVVSGEPPMLDLLGSTAEHQIAAVYVAFMGRAADAAGFEFWLDQFQAGLPAQGAKALLANIASSFAISEEAKGLHAFLAEPGNASDGEIGAFLDGVYQNLFHRSTDEAGRDYWTGQVRQKLAAGEFVGSVLVDIMSGAQHGYSGLVLVGNALTAVMAHDDLGTLMGKIAVSLEFVRAQQERGMAWIEAIDAPAATELLKDVYENPNSVLLGIKQGEDYVAAHG